MEPLLPDDVQSALSALELDIEIRFFDESTATSQMAAEAIGTELGSIVKSLCFMVDGEPVIVLASGDQRVDTRKLAALHDVAHKRVKTAKPEECVAIFGYAPGGVPPVGHRTPGITMYIEDSLARYSKLFAAGGASNAIFPIAFEDLCRVTGAAVLDLKRDA